MNVTKTLWNDFECEEFEFEGQPAKIVFPHGERNGKWLLKTEYFGAFPSFEIEMLNRGFCLAFNRNEGRWGHRKDLARKANFIDYISETYNLDSRCIPVGMSCGGLFAIKLAGLYPDKVSVLYIDAPVVNLLSCPCALSGVPQPIPSEEAYRNLGLDAKTILSYRDHPLDHLPTLIEKRIPLALVYGDADLTVAWEENALLVIEAYKGTDIPFLCICKEGVDHHPHGLEDNTPLIDFVLKHI